MMLEEVLSLEDIAKDPFRRKCFLDAFGDEKDALSECFAFLAYARKYKQLVGRRELLQNIVMRFLLSRLIGHCVSAPRSPD